MIKKATLFIFIMGVILIIFFGVILISSNKNDGKIWSPFSKPNQSPSPTPVPPNAPKTFQYDSSTDLKKELENINPQVLDSDFE